jgi:hypothetical protein
MTSVLSDRFAGLLAKGGKPANVWDQVGKPGFFRKEDLFGIPRDSEFTLAHFGEWLDNFAAEVNPGWADFNHDFGEACAYYDAAALMVNGECLRMVTKPWAENIAPPTKADVTHPLTGAVLDGVFWHRFMISARGQELIANVEHVSPAFDVDGKDATGAAVGYKLFNIAWCSGPFLDGMKPLEMTLMSKRPRITATGGAAANGARMNPDLMKRYGIDASADLEKCKAAMAAYADEVDAKMAKMEADHAEAMKKFSEEKPAEEKKPEEDKAEAEAMNALKMSLTAKGVTIPANATRAHLMSLSALHVGAKEDDAAFNARVDQRIAEREAAKAKAEREQEGAQLVTMARTAKAPDHEIAALNALVAAGDMPNARAAAQKYAAAAGNAHLMSRVTAGSHPIGKAPMPVTTFAADSPDDIETQIASKAKEHVEAEAKAGRKVLMSAAMEHVLRADKTLAAQYKSIRR